MQISKDFIKYCKGKIGKSRRDLVDEANGDSYYNRERNNKDLLDY